MCVDSCCRICVHHNITKGSSCSSILTYSIRKLSTGFATAVFTTCLLITIKATSKTTAAGSIRLIFAQSLWANADDCLSLNPLGRIEGGDSIIESCHIADVCL